jgi:hypothetical protein
MLNVATPAGEVIVYTENVMASIEQRLAQIGANKAGASGD